MDKQDIFDATEARITQFSAYLDEHLHDHDCLTRHAMDRNDSWGDLASCAEDDAQNPDLRDLAQDFADFAAEMRKSDEAFLRDDKEEV